MNRILISLASMTCLGLAATAAHAQAKPYATGLSAPQKIGSSPNGTLFVGEAGTGENDGEISRIERGGAVTTLLGGLPSGIEVTGGPSGPNGLAPRGCCIIDALMGEGDVLRFSAPPREIPNPLPSNSPIFSSLLRLHFDRPLDDTSGEFALTRADHDTLADGQTVRLENPAGEKLWVRMIGDLKDFRPDPVIDSRGSNPYGIAHGGLFDGVLIADAGQNTIVQVDLIGPPQTLVRFPPIANPPGGGPPFSDAVPTSIRHIGGGKYLVSLLTGVPFRSGAASIRLVDIHARTQSTLISGLTTATDVLKIGGKYYVLEISTNLGQQLPGRLIRLDSPTAAPAVVAAPIIGGSGMTYVARDSAIYITENFTGRVMRVALPGSGP